MYQITWKNHLKIYNQFIYNRILYLNNLNNLTNNFKNYAKNKETCEVGCQTDFNENVNNPSKHCEVKDSISERLGETKYSFI